MLRHQYMSSDFTNANGPLEAFLFFLDPPVTTDFLQRSPLDQSRRLWIFLRACDQNQHGRNICDLMRTHYAHNLAVADYARLSDRSPASFIREFTRQFSMAPQQGLI